MGSQDERLERLESQVDEMLQSLRRMEEQQQELRQWLGRWLCAPEHCKREQE